MGSVVLAGVVAAGLAAAGPAGAEIFPPMCAQGWTTSVVAAGAGNLENLDSDGAGGFYVTGIADGYLGHIDAEGNLEKLVTGLDKPAGVRVVGPYVYFLTGDGTNTLPGTLQRYEIATGEVTVLLTDLNGPNGLLLLPDGDLLFTAIGINRPPTGISRYRPSTGEYIETWSEVMFSNGMALAPDGRSIYVSDLAMRVQRVFLDAPRAPSMVIGVPDLFALPDDMEATRDDQLFLADHVVGAVYRVNPSTRSACAIATGFVQQPDMRTPADGATSVRIARDGDSWALFVTSMDGTLRRLRPPADVDLTPADARRR
ncbi:SMP-30/gluconolactonase/LRE family protein [Nocardia shimofusensis]|uniref:SMP-30/gluconolactonase/LRE family protein n=1 Tax=Nocardia shimofusensis TaxID=228596 RepID=UPI000B26A060|nr:SMP-30/gluconolactonase/LRE family protein [Nocardia shimofusensis]